MQTSIDAKTVHFEPGATWASLIDEPGALGVSVRGRTLSLREEALADVEAHVLTYRDEEGRRIYERTLQLVFLAAAERVISSPTAAERERRSAIRAFSCTPSAVTIWIIVLSPSILLRISR